MTKKTRKRHVRGRPPKSKRAKGRFIRFDKKNDAYLLEEGSKKGKTMVGILVELLELRKRFKDWQPDKLIMS